MRYVTLRGHENHIEQVLNCSHVSTVISKRVCNEAKLRRAYLESQAPGEGGLSKYRIGFCATLRHAALVFMYLAVVFFT